MSDTDPIVYRYTPVPGLTGFPGIPRADLTASRFARLSAPNRKHVAASPLYQEVKGKTAQAAKDAAEATDAPAKPSKQ